ncbi:hypothetical protein [Bailinhaonella thermotolerans]|uniref:Uncharacterized protein n=1 Tax=Bailinhaonella thermotolerans TaxID=1070861 RepID=A0A3A4AMB7_9ACTN|nr:hypothetical protein [Bailinhaonella thermotolerans]RJL30806.1 hypothetical protein D5H75_21055 [Bailinhaonella thermotolerans]
MIESSSEENRMPLSPARAALTGVAVAAVTLANVTPAAAAAPPPSPPSSASPRVSSPHAPSPQAPSPYAPGPSAGRTASAPAGESVDRRVLLTKEEQPPVGDTWKAPWINPYFEPAITGPICWEYGAPTGATGGLSARFDTSLWFYNYNDVWVFPDAAAAAAFENRWREYLTTCVERHPPGEHGTHIRDMAKVGVADGVDVWHFTTAVNPYHTITQHFWTVVVRQGRAVYAMDLLDYRDGEQSPPSFAASVAKIKERLAAYYP